jgi:hypothetical protein
MNMMMIMIMIMMMPNQLNVVCFLLGCSPASELFMFRLHRLVGVKILHTYQLMKMEQTEFSETSAYKIQTPGNCPEESIQHSEHGVGLKSRNQLKFGAVKNAILTALRYVNQILIDCYMYCHLLRRTVLSLAAWLGLSYLRSKHVLSLTDENSFVLGSVARSVLSAV